MNAAPTAAAKTVTLDEDTTHTFSAADFGFQDADPGDALASLRIAARPAAGTLALGGTPVTDNQEIAAAQLGQLVFTPPPDANGAGYASFTFRVSDGTDESALAYTITLDVTAVNDPATGLPTISGTARVGQTLTADVSAIRDDADGLPQASNFLYQWLRVSGANETPIQNADRQDLPPGGRRRRCQVQGARQLHRPRRPRRGPHQRRLADAADGFGEHRADGASKTVTSTRTPPTPSLRRISGSRTPIPAMRLPACGSPCSRPPAPSPSAALP